MPYPTQWADNDPQKFMCCDCMEILDISQCATDESDGEKVDVCTPCWEHEQEVIAALRKRP